MSYFTCGQMTVTGEPCKASVPAKGDRCRSHPRYHPRQEPPPQEPPHQRATASLPVSTTTGVLLDEALEAAERMQSDLTALTRSLHDLNRRRR